MNTTGKRDSWSEYTVTKPNVKFFEWLRQCLIEVFERAPTIYSSLSGGFMTNPQSNARFDCFGSLMMAPLALVGFTIESLVLPFLFPLYSAGVAAEAEGFEEPGGFMENVHQPLEQRSKPEKL